jgi:hypothetical protein
MAALTKEALLALKPHCEAVPTPELGEDAVIYVAEMDALSVFEFTATFRDLAKRGAEAEVDPKQLEAIDRTLERSLTDANGERLFQDGEFSAVRLPWDIRRRLFDKALELSGLKAGAEPDAAKNRAPTRTSDSRAA